MFICGWKASYSSLCTWHNNALSAAIRIWKAGLRSELPVPSNKLWVKNGLLGLMHVGSVFPLNYGLLHKQMLVLHQSTNLEMPWHQQCCVHAVSSQMHGSQDTGLRSTNRALATAVIDPHILLAPSFFYELHSMEKDKKEGIHAACVAQRSLPQGNSWSFLWSCVMRKTTGVH